MSSCPSPSNQPGWRERGRKRVIPLFFNHFSDAMVSR